MNKWSELGEKQMVGPRKSIMRGVKTRAERKLAKEKAERDYLFKEWTQWHKKRKAELLAGVHSEAAQKLADFIENMSLGDANELFELVEDGPWSDADADTCFLVLELISHGITYLRERNGLEPFDDPLPFSDDEPNVFLAIREMLR